MTIHDKRRLIGNAALCALAFVLILVNGLCGGLRFTSARMNVLTLAASFLLPTIGLLLLRRGRGLPLRTVGRPIPDHVNVTAVFSAMACCVTMLCGVRTLITNRDNMTLVATCQTNGPEVHAYATGGDDVLIRKVVIEQQFPLFSDLVWVERLHTELWAHNVSMKSIGPNTIRCTFVSEAPSINGKTVLVQTAH